MDKKSRYTMKRNTLKIKSIRIIIVIQSIIFIILGCSDSYSRPKHRYNKKTYQKTTSTNNNKGNDSKNNISETHRRKMLEVVNEWKGVGYRYGGDSRWGIDCSAFVSRIYRAVGYDIGRTTKAQIDRNRRNLRRFNPNELIFGDLIYSVDRWGDVNHVVLYLGNGKIAQSSSNTGKVAISSLYQHNFKYKYILRIFDSKENKIRMANKIPKKSISRNNGVKIYISTHPEKSDIYIDKKYIGKTPVSKNISPGYRLITLKKPGYRSYAKILKIERNGGKSFSFNMERKIEKRYSMVK